MLRKFNLTGSYIDALVTAAICLSNVPFQVLAHGDLHEQILGLTQRIQTNSSNADLWLRRADLFRNHGELAKAADDTETALKLRPGWAVAQLERARIQFDAGQFATAADSATKSLRDNPANSDALVLRARSRVQIGQLSEAVEDFNRVLTLANGPQPLPDLYLERARALAALGHIAEAIRGLDEGTSRLGETPSLILPALEYERSLGDFAAALKRVERSRLCFPAESFLTLRGEVLLQADRPSEAQMDFLAALAAIENYPPARLELQQTQELKSRLNHGLQRLKNHSDKTSTLEK